MMDILAAIGLMLVIEGALYAAFPRGMRETLVRISGLNDAQLRNLGLALAGFGLILMAMLRGF